VKRLRRRKNRPHKPFAIMCKLKDIKKVAFLTRSEAELLSSPQSPIILLRKKKNNLLADAIAPDNPYLGIMIPYTPLHHLLFRELDYLVMTSGNLQDEPIIIDDEECFQKLSHIVDYVLTNNRLIQNRNDDSIVTYSRYTNFSILRRSRGYAPDPLDLPISIKPTLGCGGELKSTFCLAHSRIAYLSPHIGDLENNETMGAFEKILQNYKRWFKIEPELIAYDLHPDYMTTRFGQSIKSGQKKPVQHHFAHIAACLAENLIEEPVIGLAFDGTGYGLDGKIWGCEFLIGNIKGLKRAGHLKYLPLPGGEASIRHPYRIALAYLIYLFGSIPQLPFINKIPRQEKITIERMVESNFNLTFTSSLGRLFDAVSAILGFTTEITFEAQAAMQLEYLSTNPTEDLYLSTIEEEDGILIINPGEIIKGIILDLKRGVSHHKIATKFHNSIIKFSIDTCLRLRSRYNLNRVAISGGAFQNRLLLEGLYKHLIINDFEPIFHRKVPYNDGGISLGQVVLANSN
ncbi:MAG: Sua5/YciO/YrdC/YwlC family protein, partial [candidate division WOR-3 bacterium]